MGFSQFHQKNMHVKYKGNYLHSQPDPAIMSLSFAKCAIRRTKSMRSDVFKYTYSPLDPWTT